MKALTIVITLLFAAPAFGADGEKSPGDFVFLRPGETTADLAIRTLGTPVIDGPDWLVKGEIDPVLAPPSPESLLALFDSGKDVVKVRVLGWRAASGPATHAMMVFGTDGRLVYALLPVSPSESTSAKIQGRMGRTPDRVESREVKVAPDWSENRRIEWYDDAGAGYMTLDGRVLAKILVAPK